ncbi:MAG: hypothetical protein AAFN13_15085, partial [Bacteroidota bacterium]
PGRFITACEELPRTTPYRLGRATLYHHTLEWELRLYDKAEELGLDGNVMRVELLMHKGGVANWLTTLKDGEGVVRAGLLAEPGSRKELTQLWIAQARRLRFSCVPCAAVAPTKASERIKLLAVRGIEASGGLSEVLAEIDADKGAGRFSREHAKSQKKALRKLVHNPAFTTSSDLDAAFAAAIDAVEARLAQ